MERELKARSARTGQERSARRPCDCGAKVSVGESGDARGAVARRRRNQTGRRADRPCWQHASGAVQTGGAWGLKAGASNHTAAVLTTPTRINGVRVRQR